MGGVGCSLPLRPLSTTWTKQLMWVMEDGKWQKREAWGKNNQYSNKNEEWDEADDAMQGPKLETWIEEQRRGDEIRGSARSSEPAASSPEVGWRLDACTLSPGDKSAGNVRGQLITPTQLLTSVASRVVRAGEKTYWLPWGGERWGSMIQMQLEKEPNICNFTVFLKSCMSNSFSPGATTTTWLA